MQAQGEGKPESSKERGRKKKSGTESATLDDGSTL